jgi:hypothetical protein
MRQVGAVRLAISDMAPPGCIGRKPRRLGATQSYARPYLLSSIEGPCGLRGNRTLKAFRCDVHEFGRGPREGGVSVVHLPKKNAGIRRSSRRWRGPTLAN